MDYLHVLIKATFTSVCLMLIGGCTGDSDSSEPQIAAVELSSPPLEILGFPPQTLYYDSPFTFTFGAAGGSGAYQMAYVKHPEINDDVTDIDTNIVDMYIENISSSADDDDAIKPAFKLEALVEFPEGASPETLVGRNYTYGLELSDGINSTSETYDFSVAANALSFSGGSIINEGASSIASINNLVTAYNAGNTLVCNQVGDISLGRRDVDGVHVYPAAFLVELEAPVSKRTTAYYKTTSKYSSDLRERNASNIEYARPDVDYRSIAEGDGKVVFEAGQSACFVLVETIDDGIIESNETFEIEFTSVEGALIDIASANKTIEIIDNEPSVTMSNIESVGNEGSSYNIPVNLRAPYVADVEIAIYVDTDKTTAEQSDYLLTPENGVLLIPAGSLNGAISVDILENEDFDDDLSEDEKIVIRTDIEDIIDAEPSEFIINDWVDNAVVARGEIGQEAVDFTIDSNGRVISLISDTSNINSVITLSLRHRSGDIALVDGLSDLVIALPDTNLKPISISTSKDEVDRIVIVYEVEAQNADGFFGRRDFGVMVLAGSESGAFDVESTSYYGSEEDDFISSTRLYGKELYVSGNTSGFMLNGEPADIANRGGVDGFVYKIDITNNAPVWYRFVGTEEDDDIKSIDAGNRDLISLSGIRTSSMDGAISSLSVSTKLTRENVDFPEISSNRDDNVRVIRYDSDLSGFSVLADGLGLEYSTTGVTSSLTRDVVVYSYDSAFNSTGYTEISSSGADVGVAMINTDEDDLLIVAGQTDGQFSDQTKLGGDDAFVTVLGREGAGYSQIGLVQFGSIQNDRVISLKEYSDSKFLVLWSEMQTDPGQETYRISAFSNSGEMLSSPL